MQVSKPVQWANAVKARDGKCMQCGALEGLHAHHIKPQATHPELRYVLENGLTLCFPCHQLAHKHNRPRAPRGTNKSIRIRELETKVATLEAANRELQQR